MNEPFPIQIVSGGIQNPYKEFSYEIPSGASQLVDYDHHSFRVLSLTSGASLSVQFEGGGKTSFIGAGVGLEHVDGEGRPIAYRKARLYNDGGTSLNVTVGLSIGKIQDNRFTTSGTITTQESKGATIQDTADVTLNNGSETLLLAAFSSRRVAYIVADPANTVNIRIGKTGTVGAARGALLQPGQTMTISGSAYNGAIYGYAGAAGQKVSLVEMGD